MSRVRVTGISVEDFTHCHGGGVGDAVTITVSVSGKMLVTGEAVARFVDGGVEYELAPVIGAALLRPLGAL